MLAFFAPAIMAAPSGRPRRRRPVRKRIYSESDVRHIFILSESRPSPVTGETGHSGRDHNTISNRSLELRDTGAGYATAFVGGFRDQIRAATALLNSQDGQDRLGELDDR